MLTNSAWLARLTGVGRRERTQGDGAVRPAGVPVAGGAWYEREAAIMGTRIHVLLWSDREDQALAAIQAVMGQMHRIDRLMSTYRPDSEVSAVNQQASLHPVTVGGELFDLLDRAAYFSRLSGGAFDVTYAAAGQLYDFRTGVAPGEVALARALSCIGHDFLQLDPRHRTVRFLRQGMRIDLGGIAKGYAVDCAAADLRRLGIHHAIITAGGDTRLVGDRRGEPWSVGIRDPRRADDMVAILPLSDTSISTSGDYERCFVEDGVRHHHIIDPATGRSPRDIRSATVIARDGVLAEALSKCLFVMGLDAGMRLLRFVGQADAVVVDAQGALHGSPGLTRLEPEPVRHPAGADCVAA